LPLQADDFSIWTITGGADSTYFDVQTGVFPRLLIWKAPFLPDFEAPGDFAGGGATAGDNVYRVIVTATSAGGSTNKTIDVTVTNIVDETAPVITSPAAVNNTENTALAHTLTATDVSAVTWSIRPGDDASHFTLTGTTLSWTSGTKDFEDPSHGPSYVVTVRATDAVALFSEQTITVTVINVADSPPAFTSGNSTTCAEQAALGFAVVTGLASTKAITGGADSVKFALVGGGSSATSHTLNWVSDAAQDYETPGDADGNRIYEVIVTATNAFGSTPQTINVTLTDVVELPPVNTDAPDISGTAEVGATLHLDSPGDWLGSPTITFTHQWYRVEEVAAGEFLTAGGDTLTADGEPLTT